VGKLARLPGTKFLPKVALHRLLDRVDDIKALVVIEMDQDGTFQINTTAMATSELCMASVVLNEYVQKAVWGKVGEKLRGPTLPEKA
jgi:hypothetical protein